jgi:sec-independent protein translocase protein TatA
MFSSLGYGEMLVFGILALVLFGGKLPEVARNFGRGYREMRKKVDDLQREFRDWDKPDYSVTPTKSIFTPPDEEPSKTKPSAPKFVPPSDESE